MNNIIFIVDPLLNTIEIQKLKSINLNISKFLTTYYQNKNQLFNLILLEETERNKRLNKFKPFKKVYSRLLKRYELLKFINFHETLILSTKEKEI